MVDGLWAGDTSLTKDFSTQVGALGPLLLAWARRLSAWRTACRRARAQHAFFPLNTNTWGRTRTHVHMYACNAPRPSQVYRMQLLGFNAVRLPFSFKDFSLPGRTDYSQ